MNQNSPKMIHALMVHPPAFPAVGETPLLLLTFELLQGGLHPGLAARPRGWRWAARALLQTGQPEGTQKVGVVRYRMGRPGTARRPHSSMSSRSSSKHKTV